MASADLINDGDACEDAIGRVNVSDVSGGIDSPPRRGAGEEAAHKGWHIQSLRLIGTDNLRAANCSCTRVQLVRGEDAVASRCLQRGDIRCRIGANALAGPLVYGPNAHGSHQGSHAFIVVPVLFWCPGGIKPNIAQEQCYSRRVDTHRYNSQRTRPILLPRRGVA